MNLLARALRFLFWLFVVSWSVWLMRRVIGWAFRKAAIPENGSEFGHRTVAGQTPGEVPARRLVRDPVCGVYVAEVLAIPLRDRGELIHFCSMACRDKYAASMQKKAANE